MTADVTALIAAARLKAFPMNLPGGVTAELVDRKTIVEVMEKHFDTVFSAFPRVPFEMPEERRERFMALREHHLSAGHRDHVLFKKDGAAIGWSFGEQQDPGSYYMRNSGIVSEHRGQGIYKAFLGQFLAYLRELGFERVTSQHLGHNAPILVAKIKAGFVITGVDMDDRFGALVRLTAYLHADRREFAARRFS